MDQILLIEDDEALAKNLVRFLQDEGFAVQHAAGQSDGVLCFSEHAFDCVLLDVSLQDGNGFSTCTALKQIADVPVLFLTASSDESCTVTGFAVGADDYIAKPFRPQELVARIHNALRHRSKLLRCADLVVEPDKARVLKQGRELFLSAVEYRLLLIFLSNKEILMTREQLANALWQYAGEYIGENTLNVYIKRLRDKIEDDPQNPKILKTVRGMGYKVVDP